MSDTDTGRPTREQVDEAMTHDVEMTDWSAMMDRAVLAAEVRALRAALAARTPQPAEDVSVATEWSLQAPNGNVWQLSPQSERHARSMQASEGGGTLVKRQVRTTRTEWVPATAPLPAFPDRAGRCGDRAPSVLGCALSFCELRAGHAGWHEVQGGAQWSHTALADGEDVPARLDAAAEVVAKLGFPDWADDMRGVADEYRYAPEDIQAAVAAALVRPTGGQE